MTLEELSKCYQEAATPIQRRLAELRKMLSETDDPEEIWNIKRRIAELTPMLTQMNDLAWMLDHYYEIGGGDRDTRYGFNGKRKAKCRKPKADGNIDADSERRAKRFAASNFPGISLREENDGSNCKGPGNQQKHRLPDIEACGEQGIPYNEVFPPDVSAFFSPTSK